MSTYRAKPGLNVALVSLTTLAPQPRSEGVKATRRVYSANGAVQDEGLYVELAWSVFVDATAYNAMLTVFGLAAARTAEVTIYARNDLYVWTRYNGLAVRPEIGQDAAWSNSRLRDVRILVKNLVAL